MNVIGLMLRSVAAPMRGDASRSMAARYVPAPPFETHAHKACRRRAWTRFCRVRAPQGEGSERSCEIGRDEVIE
jgi:hypothetical protein